MHQTSLTIAAAARHCGVHRRTLQRAIRAGRLHLTPDATLTLEALAQAGYTAPQVTPHRTAEAPQVTPQVLERIAEALTRIATSLSLLCERLASPDATVAPPRHTTRRTPLRHAAATRQSATPYDPARALARMQALRMDGWSLAQIAAALTTEGVPTRHGKPWHKGTVGYLLQRRGG